MKQAGKEGRLNAMVSPWGVKEWHGSRGAQVDGEER